MMLQASDEQASRSGANAFAYDVFVVHATAAADEAFVQGYLLAKLELPPARVLRVQTLELGQMISEEIERGVRTSRVTLVVLSSACMDDRWATFGQQLAAYVSVAQSTHGVLLPLLLEDCELTAHVESLVKLDFRDPSREVWEAEIERLRAQLDRSAASIPDLPCPYPGMRPFTEGDAKRFFGRDAELDRIVRWLRNGEREIYIIGASGSGKSSLIAAGLVPLLTRGIDGLPNFQVSMFRPGEQPTERLAAVLNGNLVVPNAAAGCDAAAGALLLVIDQLEELFAVASDDQRRGFLAALHSLKSDPNCVLVFALRADFYGSFMDSSLWTDRAGEVTHISLGPLRNDSLREIIERPARELDVYFQPELVSRLLDDAAREPGALPLLQETLFQLWTKRRQRLLALADYRALSDDARTGLAFAVKEHADDVYRRLAPPEKAIAFRIMLRLVNFGEGRADTRRQQPRDALRSETELGSDFERVLQCLVNNRLVTVTGDDQHRDVRVDLAHEILLQAWSTFADWIQTWRALEQRRRELEAAAAGWRARGGKDGGLLDPIELASARAWQDKAARQLGHTADLAAFLAGSELAHSRAIRQRRRSRLVGQIALAALALAFIAFRCASSAVEQRNQRSRLLAASAQLYQDVGWQRLIESRRPLQALPYLVAAGEATETSGGALSQSLRMLLAAATRNLPVSPSPPHDGRVLDAAFRSDGTPVVIMIWYDTARVWNGRTGDSLVLRAEHPGSVRNAAFSPDASRVVTISTDNTHNTDNIVRVWDAVTGRPLSPPVLHPSAVSAAAFSPDGTQVVTISADKTTRIWGVTSGTLRSPPLQHSSPVSSAALSPDGALVITVSKDKTARVWNADTGMELSMLLTHLDGVISVAFGPDGTQIVTASEDKTARVWDAITGKPLSPPLQHQGVVRSAAFSHDGTRVVTGSEDRTARIWDAVTGEPLSLPLEHQDAVRSAAFSPDGTRVITTSEDNTTRVWDAATSRLPPAVFEHRNAAFSSDGAHVVTASDDQTARVWDALTGVSVSPPLPHQGIVIAATFSLDGMRVFTVSVDNVAGVADGTVGRPLSSTRHHRGPWASFVDSSDDGHVATVTMRTWDAITGEPLSAPLPHQEDVLNVAFSADGTRVVTTSGNSARVWDVATGKPLSPPLEHLDTVLNATFSSDGARVVTASADKTARTWDAGTGKQMSPPLRHQNWVVSAAFNADGTRVVTASLDQTARVWDAVTGNPISPPLEHQDSVMSAGFSPDGTCVVTASSDKTARIWDAATGKSLSPSLEHRGIVRSAAFSVDGARILTASEDRTARVWNLPLASGTPGEWRTMMERVDPYVLANGVLTSRGDSNDQETPRRR